MMQWWERMPPQPFVMNPSYFLQRCPLCDGTGTVFAPYVGEDRTRLVDRVECTFCWGVGVVRVSWWSGQPEAVTPTPETGQHQWEREQAARQQPGDAAPTT